MVGIKSLLIAFTAVTSVMSAPFDFLHERNDADNSTLIEKIERRSTPSAEGTNNGYFGKFQGRYAIDLVRHLLTISQYVSPFLVELPPTNLPKNSARNSSISSYYHNLIR
jgi:hypothetical protein